VERRRSGVHRARAGAARLHGPRSDRISAGKIGLEVEKARAPSPGELFESWHKRRQKTHRSAGKDQWRWDRHLAPWLKNLRPEEVDPALLRKIIEAIFGQNRRATTTRPKRSRTRNSSSPCVN
jgi:hypothetical protein